MEKEQLDKLVTEYGDSMNEFLLAKINKERADLRFRKAQTAVSEKEDALRMFKWGDKPLEPLKV